VLNQSQLLIGPAIVLALSDDPNVNGAADPNVPGDDDPTQIRIVSAPRVPVLKTSADLTGDPGHTARRRNAAVHDHRQERRHGGRGRCVAA